MWTVATPFIDREPIMIKLWLEAFTKLDFPRKKFKLLWYNQAKNPVVIKLLEDYLAKHSGKFKEVEYVKIDKEFEENDGKGEDFCRRRDRIATTMQEVNKLRTGNLLLIEDDIIPPSNAWKIMKKEFDKSKEVWGVTACQISRQAVWPDNLLAWNVAFDSTFGPQDSSSECDWKTINITEIRKGVEEIGATATGFILLRKEFLDNHVHIPEGSRGQDILTGVAIKKAGKKLMMCWNIKLVHMGKDKKGRFKLFRRDWETEVIDEYGTRY